MMRIGLTVALALALVGNFATVRGDDASHRKAAEEMFNVMNMEKQMDTAINQMVDVQVKANPQLAQVKGAMKQFMSKYLRYSAIKDDLIKIYTAEFTEAELKELTAFYRTPVGKKSIEKMPALMQKGSELGMKRVQENAAELQQMIQDELKKKP